MKIKNPIWLMAAVMLLGFLAPLQAIAIDPDEVRNFEDVFVISGYAPDRSTVEVSWDIAPDYYLYNNRFLEFSIQTEGVVMGEPEIPAGKVSFDELLGEEVEKYQGRLTVHLPLLAVDSSINGLRVKVRSQGCLESVLCYPPTEQMLLVGLPAVATGPEPAGPEADPLDLMAETASPPALSDSALSGLAANPLSG
ncbi:MAG TPA: protein-disulfide reductase DsbD N-terminal domain-containing protein, partial [Xanthomonadales bacterium]|nr:protein-disulfide reductase DsbD N-terminal domain-containing protein [Xanthomonadales bacterium]